MFQTVAPSLWRKHIIARPSPPTGRMMVSRYTSGLEAYP